MRNDPCDLPCPCPPTEASLLLLLLHQRQKPLSRSPRSLCARPAAQMRNPACPRKREGTEAKKSPQASEQSHSTGMAIKTGPRLRDPAFCLSLAPGVCSHNLGIIFLTLTVHTPMPNLSLLSLLLLPGITKRGFAAAQWTNSIAGGRAE